MALREAILAALADGEASGYDLTKRFGVAVANFWTATPQQLYRELERLEADGMVTARVVEQERRPNKRMCSLTDAGWAALRAFTTADAKPTAIRDELLVQVQVADVGDTAAVRAHLAARVTDSERKLADYERLREHMLAGRTQADLLADDPRLGPYLTLARGIAFERENIAWARFALDALGGRAAD